jgi:ABC-type bacteriocin/lantibiotic exporter with double-glycine peptidase domain
MDSETQKTYWSRIAYVKQEAFMLHDSILKNITLTDQNYETFLLNAAITNSGVRSFIEISLMVWRK